MRIDVKIYNCLKKYNIKTPIFTLAYIINKPLTSPKVFLYLKNQIIF